MKQIYIYTVWKIKKSSYKIKIKIIYYIKIHYKQLEWKNIKIEVANKITTFFIFSFSLDYSHVNKLNINYSNSLSTLL